jgi:hypothetical protein
MKQDQGVLKNQQEFIEMLANKGLTQTRAATF